MKLHRHHIGFLVLGLLSFLGIAAWLFFGEESPRESATPAPLIDQVTVGARTELTELVAEQATRATLPTSGSPNRVDEDTPRLSTEVCGRVVDQNGLGFPAKVLVWDAASTRDPRTGLPRETLNEWRGEWIRTDPSGHFAFTLERAKEAFLFAQRLFNDLSIEMPPLDGSGDNAAWGSPSSGEITLVLERKPHATVRIHAFDEISGEPLSTFRYSYRGKGGIGNGIARENPETLLVPVVDEGEITMTFGLISPVADEPISAVARLFRGDTKDVHLGLPGMTTVSGTVVDPHGSPIEGVVVLIGKEHLLRSNELFERNNPSSWTDVRSDASGAFTAEGVGEFLTAWHPEYATTVLSKATNAPIEMKLRGSLRVAFEAARYSQIHCSLDADMVGYFDDEGFVQFENIDPGEHLVSIVFIGRWLVNIESAEEVFLDLRAFRRDELQDRELILLRDGQPYSEATAAILVGQSSPALLEIGSFESGRGTMRLPRHGAMRLFTPEGHIAEFELSTDPLTIELGEAGTPLDGSTRLFAQ